jgi:ElaA protein
MQTSCLKFDNLSTHQLYDLLRLRSEVFVVEQTCIYQDIDDKDTQANVHHLLITKDSDLFGYARLLPAGLSYDTPSFGRVIIAKQARGSGFGKQLIASTIEHMQLLWPNQSITIGAQSHLVSLYQSFGFAESSEHYLEDGIPHVDMCLKGASSI